MDFIKEDDSLFKLYRTIDEIIHPSISKKNISNYQIVVDDNYSPIRVFYPNKVSNIDSVIIFIPGESDNYNSVCSELSVYLDRLIIKLEIDKDSMSKVEDFIDYLFNKLNDIGIKDKNIILMSDSYSCDALYNITCNFMKNKKHKINKEIMFNPIINEYYSNDYPNTLLLCGSLDPNVDNYNKSGFDVKVIDGGTSNLLIINDIGVKSLYFEVLSKFI